MSMNTSVMLVGNGFNCSIRDYLRGFVDNSLINTIEDVINLWTVFNDTFSKFAKSQNWSIEETIEKFYSSLEILSLFNISEKENRKRFATCLQTIRESVEYELHKSVMSIIQSFINLEVNGFYTKLTSYKHRTNLNPVDLIKENNIQVYTTNYDGIIDIILSYDNKIKDFVLGDLFRDCSPKEEEYVCYNPYIGDDHRLYHLHGSYKFWFYKVSLYTSRVIKIKSGHFGKVDLSNKTPLIILNAPSKKMDFIRESDLLKKYYSFFIKDLQNSKNLIVWGISLNADPHIEYSIKRNFLEKRNDDRRLFIISDKPTEHKLHYIVKRFEYKGLKVYPVNVSSFRSIDELLSELIKKMGK